MKWLIGKQAKYIFKSYILEENEFLKIVKVMLACYTLIQWYLVLIFTQTKF
jgi:hypothetical protein